MIEFASKSDFEEIVKLWNISFGDSVKTIERFLHTFFTDKNCLVIKENSSIISMLFLLESEVVSDALTHPTYYIYAACTLPENRGKGVMSKLLKHTIDFASKENKDFLCLVPGEEHLFEYYARFGFKKIFKRKDFILSKSIMKQLSENGAEICQPSIKTIKTLRDKTLATGSRLLWGENVIQYAIEENERSGGASIFIQKNAELIGYVVYKVKDDTVIIEELCIKKYCFGLLASVLINQLQSDYFQFSLPLEFPLSVDNSTIRDNGMILSLNPVGSSALETMFQAFIGFTLE